MVEKFDWTAIRAGAILTEHPKLSIELIIQMLALGQPPWSPDLPLVSRHTGVSLSHTLPA
jgi:hypothetical protein